MRITICGGGSLGHVCAGVLSSHPANEVNILTGHPQQWQHHVTVDDPKGRIIQGNIQTITSSAQETIPHSDIVLLCVPGPLIEPILNDLRPHLTERNKVGAIVSSTGFFFKAHRILPSCTQLFGFQRVPYISRIQEYGSSAHLLGYKKALSAATENIAHPEEFCELLSELFLTPVTLLNNYYEASFPSAFLTISSLSESSSANIRADSLRCGGTTGERATTTTYTFTKNGIPPRLKKSLIWTENLCNYCRPCP